MKKFKVGLQLYSIRDEMEANMDETLAKVKEMGYDYVEFAGFFDYSASEVKAMLQKHGLTAISVHQSPTVYLEQGQAAIDYLKELGVGYCAVPWWDASKLKGSDEWDNTVKIFKDYSDALKKAGIDLLYHNHDFEFKKYEDKFLFDWIYDTLGTDVIAPQIDTCWVRYSGNDPVAYIKKYAGKIKLLHLKDFNCKSFASGPVYELIGNDDAPSKEDNGFEFKPVGSGIQDFPAILEAAEEAGIEYVIVEQDGHPENSSLEDAKISREYLKTLGI